jgi:CRISPR-associated Csx10 family RAMP protein
MVADRTTARDPGGAPIVPASALKGALRIEFERLLAGLRQVVCHASTPDQACPPQAPCPACQLFGAPGRQGLLRFYDARLVDQLRAFYTRRSRQDRPEAPTGLGYAIRPGVAINRRRRVAQEELLYLSDVAEPPSDERLVFTADIEALGPVPDQWLLWLKAAVASLRAIGGGKSRGLGHIEEAWLEEVPQERPPGNTGTVGSASRGCELRVVLLAEEYVRAGAARQEANFLSTVGYLPGGAVRGAIAYSFVWREKGGNWHDEEVARLLLGSSFVVTNFYPALYSGGQPRPIPLSARTCKRYPSFHKHEVTSESPRPGHGSRDILIDATLVKLLRSNGSGRGGIPVVMDDRCTQCGEALQPLGGFCLDPWHLSLGPGEGSLKRRLVTKTAINRARFTSAEGQLYSYEVLDTGLEWLENGQRVRFIGAILAAPDEVRRHLSPGLELLVGGARHRGFGRVKVELLEEARPEEVEQLRERMKRFSDAIGEVLGTVCHPKSDRLFFSITLTSDLVLPLGRGVEWLVQELRERLHINDLLLEKYVTQVTYVGGFNAAVGLPKELMPALAMGSAFVFSCPQKYEEALLKDMPLLLREGLGWRREEGYGRFTFCDEFHLKRRIQS